MHTLSEHHLSEREDREPISRWEARLRWMARYGIALVMIAAGVGLLVSADDMRTAAGAALITLGCLVVLANLLVRLAIDSQYDRDEEEEAREEFANTGQWAPQDPHARVHDR